MTKATKNAPASAQTVAASSKSTKDQGVVQVGGAAIRFASTKDAGFVQVGGAAIRF